VPCALDRDAVNDVLQRLDGLIISGGGDLAPSYYNEEPHEQLGAVDPVRDALDAAIIPAALERDDLAVLGICRGIQVINVFCGGTLYQDLSQRESTTLQHRQQAPREHASHEVQVDAGTALCGVLGAATVVVNSFHHQAVREVARDFVVSARSSDGVIEGIELPGHRFCVAVQWHPEHMTEHHPHAKRIFRAFVRAAGDE
jgi:putative glutamine amidotransferase